MRQLELLVFGPRPAARVGEGGLLKCVFVAVWLQLVTKTATRTVAAMPLIGHAKHHFRGACGAYNVILRRLRRANDDLDEVCGLHLPIFSRPL